MSTSLIDVDNTWQNVQAGPLTGISISAIAQTIYYQLTPTSPAAADRGHILNPADGVNVDLTGTDNLWVRASGDVNAQIAITI